MSFNIQSHASIKYCVNDLLFPLWKLPDIVFFIFGDLKFHQNVSRYESFSPPTPLGTFNLVINFFLQQLENFLLLVLQLLSLFYSLRLYPFVMPIRQMVLNFPLRLSVSLRFSLCLRRLLQLSLSNNQITKFISDHLLRFKF